MNTWLLSERVRMWNLASWLKSLHSWPLPCNIYPYSSNLHIVLEMHMDSWSPHIKSLDSHRSITHKKENHWSILQTGSEYIFQTQCFVHLYNSPRLLSTLGSTGCDPKQTRLHFWGNHFLGTSLPILSSAMKRRSPPAWFWTACWCCCSGSHPDRQWSLDSSVFQLDEKKHPNSMIKKIKSEIINQKPVLKQHKTRV